MVIRKWQLSVYENVLVDHEIRQCFRDFAKTMVLLRKVFLLETKIAKACMEDNFVS